MGLSSLDALETCNSWEGRMQLEFDIARTQVKLEDDFSLPFLEVTDENVACPKGIGIEGDLLSVDIYGLVHD